MMPSCTYGLHMFGSERPVTDDVLAAGLPDGFGGAGHGGRRDAHHQRTFG